MDLTESQGLQEVTEGMMRNRKMPMWIVASKRGWQVQKHSSNKKGKRQCPRRNYTILGVTARFRMVNPESGCGSWSPCLRNAAAKEMFALSLCGSRFGVLDSEIYYLSYDIV